MASIKRDDSKQKWEETEFPLVCETCLGDNPYIRMTKEPHGKKCKICETPFTVFAWQAGTRGRLKKVEICRSCARSKNVCQVCIFDLQYGLPVQLRDRILAEEGSKNAVAAVPQSDANRAWYAAQQERAIEQGKAGAVPTASASLRLQAMARMEPRYERNLPKLCSFFARGECNRGMKCPFRHEMPRDRNDPLSKQNTKDRFYGTDDPVAQKMINRQKERVEKRREEAKARGDGEGDERAVSTLYVRLVDNKDPSSAAAAARITEADVRDKFYSYGEIVSVRMHANKGAFVEYTTADATELAIASMNRQEVRGQKVYVNWARRPKRGNEAQGRQQQSGNAAGGSATGEIRPAPPPGQPLNSGGAAPLPPGFAPVRPSAEVSAAAAAARSAHAGSGRIGSSGGIGVPRPGGGVIRRPGRSAAPKPYYPSADPGRLGTSSASSSAR
eukprot:CAMPEP_0185723968 /NCGR_PEP_ID=MMETSP1171-20130828/612_1 /TAXON_ID=374046 /ORGANISM="Helicotheca tamensis, Strain CCMP826" /LENGTH=443 /DNA_ID=CAMNT_0028391739 /DNA_START=76 /DNA_END=1407 /DNA_ORIENTATION=+